MNCFSAVEFFIEFQGIFAIPKMQILQIVIGQQFFQWFQQFYKNSNTSCQKYPRKS